ncbi:hypothetical protein AOLI_G00289050 [Acnodon oligacanthus]
MLADISNTKVTSAVQPSLQSPSGDPLPTYPPSVSIVPQSQVWQTPVFGHGLEKASGVGGRKERKEQTERCSRVACRVKEEFKARRKIQMINHPPAVQAHNINNQPAVLTVISDPTQNTASADEDDLHYSSVHITHQLSSTHHSGRQFTATYRTLHCCIPLLLNHLFMFYKPVRAESAEWPQTYSQIHIHKT